MPYSATLVIIEKRNKLLFSVNKFSKTFPATQPKFHSILMNRNWRRPYLEITYKRVLNENTTHSSIFYFFEFRSKHYYKIELIKISILLF